MSSVRALLVLVAHVPTALGGARDPGQCAADLTAAIAGVTSAAKFIDYAVTSCVGTPGLTTQATCAQDITASIADFSGTAKAADAAASSCGNINQRCSKDIINTILSFSGSSEVLSGASMRCDATLPAQYDVFQCVVDVLDAVDTLTHGSKSIYDAVGSCQAGQADDGMCDQHPGYDCETGEDIPNTTTTQADPAACCAKCTETPGCKSWSWNTDLFENDWSRKCFLKYSCTKIRVNNKVITGYTKDAADGGDGGSAPIDGGGNDRKPCTGRTTGQVQVQVPGCIGIGCNANGDDQNCAWCVYDMAACVPAYGQTCYLTKMARDNQDVECSAP